MQAPEKLRRWRKARGLSQAEAATKAGLTKAAWQSYETGSSPKASAVDAIQRVTDGEVALSDWIESDEAKLVRRARAAAARVRTGRQPAKDESGPLVDDEPTKAAS